MRRGIACLFLCLSSTIALAEEAGSLPTYFQESWDIVAAQPLTVFTPHRAAPSVATADLPEIIRSGVPKPPERPIVSPTAAAYASVTSPGPISLPMVAIPLPIRRPADIAPDLAKGLSAAAERDAAVPQAPQTKVAMLGALPGAGVAIGALARMEPMAPIVKGSCSVGNPFKVSALGPGGRTSLSPEATLDLPMVQKLVNWEDEMQAAARKTLGEPIKAIHVAASYDCRTMNHRSRARLSEHAHANAIDISEYETESGKWVTVAKDFYAGGEKGAFLHQVHANTCDLFQVVLGPGSDGMHENHFHMDLGHWKACR
jgi:hypothetical protein